MRFFVQATKIYRREVGYIGILYCTLDTALEHIISYPFQL
jgi:hypothetical protein